MTNIYVFAAARNEAENMVAFADSLLNQTILPFKVTVIDDGSTDATAEIAKSYGFTVISLPHHPQSYLQNIATSYKIGQILNHAFPPPANCEFMMQTSPDITVPPDYLEILSGNMFQDKKLVIASGRIKGEYSAITSPRGAGRLYKTSFWNAHIQKYPPNNTWESYPCYKAWSLGYKTANFENAPLYSCRRTLQYKPHYGKAMAELGYYPPYALIRCLIPLVKKLDVRMLISYLQSGQAKYDDIKQFLYYRQSRNIAGYIRHPSRFLKSYLQRIKNVT